MVKVSIFVGSRANFFRLRSITEELINAKYDVEIIQGYFELPEFQEYVKLKSDTLMYYDTEYNMVNTEALLSQQVSTFFRISRPDLAIVHGDRYETLGYAKASAYMNIPLCHLEAGDTSGNIDDKIRWAITALSDYHFSVSEESYNKLVKAGYNKVYNIGSPALDVVKQWMNKNEKRAYAFKYILVLYHPCAEDNFAEFFSAIQSLDEAVIWVNPNVDPGNKKMLKVIHSRYTVTKNLSPHEFLNVLAHCKYMLGNSSAGIKEASFLGVPYILVGDRQKGREIDSNVITCKCKALDILSVTEKVKDLKDLKVKPSNKFGCGDSGKKFIDILKGVIFNEEV